MGQCFRRRSTPLAAAGTSAHGSPMRSVSVHNPHRCVSVFLPMEQHHTTTTHQRPQPTHQRVNPTRTLALTLHEQADRRGVEARGRDAVASPRDHLVARKRSLKAVLAYLAHQQLAAWVLLRLQISSSGQRSRRARVFVCGRERLLLCVDWRQRMRLGRRLRGRGHASCRCCGAGVYGGGGGAHGERPSSGALGCSWVSRSLWELQMKVVAPSNREPKIHPGNMVFVNTNQVTKVINHSELRDIYKHSRYLVRQQMDFLRY